LVVRRFFDDVVKAANTARADEFVTIHSCPRA
jgi:hypothetical protein